VNDATIVGDGGGGAYGFAGQAFHAFQIATYFFAGG